MYLEVVYFQIVDVVGNLVPVFFSVITRLHLLPAFIGREISSAVQEVAMVNRNLVMFTYMQYFFNLDYKFYVMGKTISICFCFRLI